MKLDHLVVASESVPNVRDCYTYQPDLDFEWKSEELDRLVEEGKFGSRSETLRYGARLVTHEEATKRLHVLTQALAREQVQDRLERKPQAAEQRVYLDRRPPGVAQGR